MACSLFSCKKRYDMIEIPKQFFVAGTDTGIGKSLVSAMLMSSLDATYWKPIQSGLDEETDSEFVQRVSEVDDSKIIEERWRLTAPMSPHASADIDGVSIGLNDFSLPQFTTRHMIVEGAGGLLVPINWQHTMLDLIDHLGLPVLLVAKSGLGTLNHTLLSLKALRDRSITVFGVILSGTYHDSNRETLRHFGGLSIYEVGYLTSINRKTLQSAFSQLVSLEK